MPEADPLKCVRTLRLFPRFSMTLSGAWGNPRHQSIALGSPPSMRMYTDKNSRQAFSYTVVHTNLRVTRTQLTYF